MRLTRAAFLLLPVAGVFAVDPLPFDFHAVKFVALLVVGAAALAGAVAAGLFAWTQLSLPLWIFTAVRGIEILRAPPSDRALRWWALLLTLTLAHHVVAAAAPRRWLRRRLVPVLAGLGVAVALFAIVQRFSEARQAHAFFANRNFAGAGLAMLLPYALATRRRWLGVVVLLGVLATGSRGGMLAAAVAGAWWAGARLPRFRWLFVGALPVCVLAAGLALGDANTVKVRRHWYRAAWTLGLEQPLLGHGADGFQREYPPIRPAEEYAISGGRRVHAVHDDYLEAWADGGLLGLGAMLLLVVLALRAARADEPVLESWLAFSAAAVVDLPWRDPALLTIAFAGLSLVAERRVLAGWARPAAAVGLAGVLLLAPDAVRHWVADRAFGRYLTTREGLDDVLRWERRHPEALIERSRPEDLDLLLEQRPHDAAAWHNRSLELSDAEAIALLRTVIRVHDPHDARCRLRLARLLYDAGDRASAAVVLEEAVAPPPAVRVLQSRILRESGNIERAEHWLDTIPPARFTPAVLREMLEVELANLRRRLWEPKRIDFLVRNLPAIEVQERIETPLARAEAVVANRPKPDVPRREGESPDAYLERVHEAQMEWRRALRTETEPDFREAFLLAEALCRHAPTVTRLRQKARAARGYGDVERAGHFESQALFLEALEALADLDPVTARRKVERAVRAYPGVVEEPEVVVAVRFFAEANPKARRLAEEIFSPYPALKEALAR